MDPARVELKVSVGGDRLDAVRRELGFRKSAATQATIWFADLPLPGGGASAFALADRGVIVRLRRQRGLDAGGSDATVKFRREAPFLLPAGWPPTPDDGFKVEGDWTAKRRTVAASLSATVGADLVDAIAQTGRLSARLFADQQRRFATDLVMPDPVDLAALRPLGPIRAWRWEEAERDDLGNELGAELWEADDLAFFEMSMRVKLANAPTWLERFTKWAEDKRLPPSMGITKTQAVMEHFAARPAPPTE